MAALRLQESDLDFVFRPAMKGISPTNAARFDWRRCLPRTEAFE